MPETVQALEKYLANANIKGIGEAISKRITKKFGIDTLNILKYDPIRLTEVKGITEEKARQISESFIEGQEVWQIVAFLERFGISVENAKKIYDTLGIDAIEKIEKDPYILIDLARGVDFTQIDKMALKLGINYDNEKRVQSGIKYSLIRVTNNGHSCTLKQNLIEFVSTLLDVTSETIEDNLINLKMKDEIVIENREKEEWVFLSSFYYTEQEIALRINRLNKSKNMKKIEHIESAQKKIEKT